MMITKNIKYESILDLFSFNQRDKLKGVNCSVWCVGMDISDLPYFWSFIFEGANAQIAGWWIYTNIVPELLRSDSITSFYYY